MKTSHSMNFKKMLKLIPGPLFPHRLKAILVYRREFGRMPALLNPRTFNEKILRKRLFDRNPKLTLFADKLLARGFVESRLKEGSQYLTKLYAVVDSPVEIHTLRLPKQFVMKPNHLSGAVKIVRDLNSLSTGELETLATAWLRTNHFDLAYEWAYKHIKPRVLFEELLEPEGGIPDDWKFFCFDGRPRFVHIDRGRFGRHQRNIYDLNLSLLPVLGSGLQNFRTKMDTSPNFDTMLEIAARLSTGSDFVRVDLYNIRGRIVFGELTNYPAAGFGKFDPPSWDLTFGSYWQ